MEEYYENLVTLIIFLNVSSKIHSLQMTKCVSMNYSFLNFRLHFVKIYSALLGQILNANAYNVYRSPNRFDYNLRLTAAAAYIVR